MTTPLDGQIGSGDTGQQRYKNELACESQRYTGERKEGRD